ncbi:MAG: YvcK family protein [Coriobacteriaceae bacterium]|jgi:uncharacterized cofD-like protein|nr:YvcK family protein [Coriobacteriaceae bacterium]
MQGIQRPFRTDPSVTAAFKALKDERPLVSQDRPMRAVVIGGGTGAPISIRTLLSMGLSVSAVVAMADDGGSTGILREEARVTPPGDVRKCLAAFARDPEDPLTKAFKYRFAFARNHTLGNLMLSALEEASGSFPEAIRICESLLDAQGHVYPSTLDKVTLAVRTRNGHTLRGQAKASASPSALERAWLEAPESCRPYEGAVRAIHEADLIVLGPGSLFTSIIPNLLVPGMVEAIAGSAAHTVFVCSLADTQGETRGLSASDHVDALLGHGMHGLLDFVLVHAPGQGQPPADAPLGVAPGSSPAAAHAARCTATPGSSPAAVPAAVHAARRTATPGSSPAALPVASPAALFEPMPVPATRADLLAIERAGVTPLARPLRDPLRPTWHDPHALRDALVEVLALCRSLQR